MSTSSPVPVHIVNGKKFPEVLRKRGGGCCFLCHPMHHDFVGFTVEMFGCSDIYSQSRVPVEVAQSRPCSTGLGSLVNLLFPFPSFHVPPDSHPELDSDRSVHPTTPFFLRRSTGSLFPPPVCLNLPSLSCSESFRSFPQIDLSLISFFASV